MYGLDGVGVAGAVVPGRGGQVPAVQNGLQQVQIRDPRPHAAAGQRHPPLQCPLGPPGGENVLRALGVDLTGPLVM